LNSFGTSTLTYANILKYHIQGIVLKGSEGGIPLTKLSPFEELAHQDVIHVKQFISKRKGQAVKLNTFLITFDFPTILSSIRMGLYNVKFSPYVPNLIRCFNFQQFGHSKCKGKLKCFKCGEEDHEGFDCNNNQKCSNYDQPHMASSKDCQHFMKEKEIRKKISHTLRRSDSSDSPVQKSYARVAKRVFSSVEAQAMFTWIEDTEKPTRLTKTIRQHYNSIIQSIKFFSDSHHFK
jgi:hypothetical protein